MTAIRINFRIMEHSIALWGWNTALHCGLAWHTNCATFTSLSVSWTSVANQIALWEDTTTMWATRVEWFWICYMYLLWNILKTLGQCISTKHNGTQQQFPALHHGITWQTCQNKKLDIANSCPMNKIVFYMPQYNTLLHKAAMSNSICMFWVWVDLFILRFQTCLESVYWGHQRS